jgi:hypothetical protein
MPRQSHRQQLLQTLNQIKSDLTQRKYYDLVGDLLEELIKDIPDSDLDMSDSFSDNFSALDPLSDDSIDMFDSSDQLSDHLFSELIDVIGVLEDEVQKARVLRNRTRLSHAPQLHLLDEWALHDTRRFRRKLRVDPGVFDKLVECIENHPIFGSERQLPVEVQLAIFLNRAGHYGNAATTEDVADWAGVSVGTVYNCSNRVMIAIAALHDDAISWNPQDPRCIHEKARAKEWVESRAGPEWRDGYLTGDGSCFPLFQKPGLHGESFYDRKCNYSLNCQVPFYFILLSSTFSNIFIRLSASHTIYKLWTTLLA